MSIDSIHVTPRVCRLTALTFLSIAALAAEPVTAAPMHERLAQAGISSPPAAKVQTSSPDMRERVVGADGAYLMLDQDNTLYGWGYTFNGVLGPMPEKIVLEPTAIDGLPPMVKIAANPCVGAGIDQDGQVWVWGLNNYGTVDPSLTPELTILAPRIMEGLPAAQRVFVFTRSIVVLGEDGSLWGWGDDLPGLPDVIVQYPALLEENIPGTPALSWVVSVTSSYGGYYALDEAGQVWNWAFDNDVETPDPRILVTGLPSIKAVQGTSGVVVGLDSQGQVWTWSYLSNAGSNSCELMGRTYTDATIPAPIPGLSGITQVASSFLHVMVKSSAGLVWGWGCNEDGGMGTGDLTSPRSTVTRLPHLDHLPFLGLDTSTGFSTDPDGQLLYWGSNWFGAQADGTTSVWPWTSVPQDPTHAPGTAAPATILGSSGDTTHLIDASGYLWGAGRNDNGELGDGTSSAKDHWVAIQPTQRFVQVVASSSATAALDVEGRVWTWGWNSHGQLGDPTGEMRPTPAQMPNFATVKKLTATDYGFLALDDAGQVWTWGANFCHGDSSTPQRIDLGSAGSAVDISSMNLHLLLKDRSGKLWAMGDNDAAQLGVPGYFPRCRPVQVRGLPTIAAFEAGVDASFALDTSGKLWAWGENTWGELGTGATSAKRWQPGQVQGLPALQQFRLGDRFVVGLDSQGQVWFWGLNAEFPFPDQYWKAIPTPTKLALGKPVKSVMAGEHIFYRHTDGTLGATGLSEYGALGIGNAWTPTEVDSTVLLGTD